MNMKNMTRDYRNRDHQSPGQGAYLQTCQAWRSGVVHMTVAQFGGAVVPSGGGTYAGVWTPPITILPLTVREAHIP